MATPASSEDVYIELGPAQPYIDVPVEATAPTEITITTNTGTPQEPGFLDSWVELWQDSIRLAYDDDGGHSENNVLSSRLVRTIEAGFYFVRATSFSWAASGGTQTPTGNYTLNITGVLIATPSPTPTPTPQTTTEPQPTSTPEPTPTPTEPATPEPEPTPTTTDTPSPTPQPTEPPTPEPSTPQTEEPTSNNQEQTTPPEVTNTPQPEATATSEPTEPEDPQSSDLEQLPPTLDPPTDDPSLPVEEPTEDLVDTGYLQSVDVVLDAVGAAISEAVAATIEAISETLTAVGEAATAAAEAFMAIGSDMTEEQRETSQTVVISAVVVTQIQALRRIK